MNTRFSLLVTAVLLAVPGLAQDRKEVDLGRIDFDPRAATLAVRGEGLLLSQVLVRLQQQHGIRITVADFQDRTIDADLPPRPLTDALDQLLGSGVRYRLEVAGGDLVLPGRTGAQQPRAGDAPRLPADRPLMGAGIPVLGRPTMPSAEQTAPAHSRGPGAMAPVHELPAQIRDLAELRRALPQSGAAPAAAGRHAVVLLRFRRDAEPVVERIVEQDGVAPTGGALTGELLWEVAVGDQLLAVGAIQDPLAVFPICDGRPADPRLRPTRTFDDEGLVVLLVDATLLDPANLGRATFRFHRLTDGRDLPRQVTRDNFAALRARSTPAGAVADRSLRNARIERQ